MTMPFQRLITSVRCTSLNSTLKQQQAARNVCNLERT